MQNVLILSSSMPPLVEGAVEVTPEAEGTGEVRFSLDHGVVTATDGPPLAAETPITLAVPGFWAVTVPALPPVAVAEGGDEATATGLPTAIPVPEGPGDSWARDTVALVPPVVTDPITPVAGNPAPAAIGTSPADLKRDGNPLPREAQASQTVSPLADIGQPGTATEEPRPVLVSGRPGPDHPRADTRFPQPRPEARVAADFWPKAAAGQVQGNPLSASPSPAALPHPAEAPSSAARLVAQDAPGTDPEPAVSPAGPGALRPMPSTSVGSDDPVVKLDPPVIRDIPVPPAPPPMALSLPDPVGDPDSPTPPLAPAPAPVAADNDRPVPPTAGFWERFFTGQPTPFLAAIGTGPATDILPLPSGLTAGAAPARPDIAPPAIDLRLAPEVLTGTAPAGPVPVTVVMGPTAMPPVVFALPAGLMPDESRSGGEAAVTAPLFLPSGPIQPVSGSPTQTMGLPVPLIAAQLTAALSQNPSGVTELALSPEELGPVRLRLEPDSSNPDRMVVLISVERPETLDLFRRNAGELAEALRAAGYAGADIGFSQGQGQDASQGQSPRADPEIASHIEETKPPSAPRRVVAGAALDLRL
jgi:hypothetical protein